MLDLYMNDWHNETVIDIHILHCIFNWHIIQGFFWAFFRRPLGTTRHKFELHHKWVRPKFCSVRPKLGWVRPKFGWVRPKFWFELGSKFSKKNLNNINLADVLRAGFFFYKLFGSGSCQSSFITSWFQRAWRLAWIL